MANSSLPVRDSIREIDESHWAIGETILLSRQTSPSTNSWSDGRGSFFAISSLETPIPKSRALSVGSGITLVCDTGGKSAVWRVGEAFCKVRAVEYQDTTQEHTTLLFVREKRPVSFDTPQVIHHEEHNGRYYLFTSRVEGETIAEAWASMNESLQSQTVAQVARICQEMASWTRNEICGVDGKGLPDELLAGGKNLDFSPSTHVANCEYIGMDCSAKTFHFYHCNMEPGNVIINSASGSLGLIGWKTAGYVPREWIRTKIYISRGLDFSKECYEPIYDWRKRIQSRLGKEGYDHVAHEWKAWYRSQ